MDFIIRGNTIAIEQINQCITDFDSLSATDQKLNFYCPDHIADIDVLLPAYFMLFKMKRPELVINLRLQENEPIDDETSVLHKLQQCCTYAFLMLGRDVFQIYVKKIDRPITFWKAIEGQEHLPFQQRRKKFRDGWLVLSKRFMLLLAANDSLHDGKLQPLLFTGNPNELIGHNWFLGNLELTAVHPHPDECFTIFSNQLWEGLTPDEPFQAIQALGKISFLKALTAARISSYYLQSIYLKGDDKQLANSLFRIGHWRKNKERNKAFDYFKIVQPVFDELARLPLLYTFVFSQLLTSGMFPQRTDAEPAAFGDQVQTVWKFAKDLAYGLREIALNAVQHSDTHAGVIAARFLKAFDQQDITISALQQQLLDAISEDHAGQPLSLLEMHVADLGSDGIVKTLLIQTESNPIPTRGHPEFIAELKKDREALQTGLITLKDLVRPHAGKILHQQSKRSMAHLGLLIFSQLIEKNHGALLVSSPDLHRQIEKVASDKRIYPGNAIQTGTHFSFVLPVFPETPYETNVSHSEISLPYHSQSNRIEGLEVLHNIVTVDEHSNYQQDEAGRTYLIKKNCDWALPGREDEALHWQQLVDNLNETIIHLPKGAKCLLAFDFEGTMISASQLFRFTGLMQSTFSSCTHLLVNLTNDLYFKFWEINKYFHEVFGAKFPFWSESNVTLVYHYLEYAVDSEVRRFYFTDGLWGKRENDFLEVNRLIQRNHFNATAIVQDRLVVEPMQRINLNHSAAFYNQQVLLPLDLLLKGPGGQTLFELNARVLLNNPIQLERPVAATSIAEKLRILPGYQVDGGHFKIGNKIHVTTYYYAKGFFHNSFFAMRFAFLLSNKIHALLQQKKPANLSKGLSLVGYGLYAELLLSFTEQFLKKLLGNIPLRHHLMRDNESPKLMNEDLLPNALIIVPIASTFSTPIKMEEAIRANKRLSHCYVLPDHFNVLHVCETSLSATASGLEESFGWGKKDIPNQQIEVAAFFDKDSIRFEHYLMQLQTEWQAASDCQDCFGAIPKEHPEQEKPLIETDSNAVTPAVIFYLPNSTTIDEGVPKIPFVLTPAMIDYRNNTFKSHFIYRIDTERFLEKNEAPLIEWLTNVRTTSTLAARVQGARRPLLISSSNDTNLAFIHLVNKHLFGGSANLIHYDPTGDYVQNFELIYGNDIYSSDLLLFVDDILKTGRTFRLLEHFVREAIRLQNLKHVRQRELRIDACLFMVNKSQPSTLETVRTMLADRKEVHAMANLHLFTSISEEGNTPLPIQARKYLQLECATLLESLSRHFRAQAAKITTTERDRAFSEISKERHLLMLEATHRLYSYFATRPALPGNFSTFAATVTQLQVFNSKYDPLYLESTRFSPLEAGMLKVLTQSPFSQYLPIRLAVFDWVNKLILEVCAQIDRECADNVEGLRYETFHDFKFLLRRATLLNSNILFSDPVLKSVSILQDKNGVDNLKGKLERRRHHFAVVPKKQPPKWEEDRLNAIDRDENVNDFDVFFSAQIKELLAQNEHRAVYLARQLALLKQAATSTIFNLRDLLLIENAGPIQQFYDFIEPHLKASSFFDEKETSLQKLLPEDELIKILKDPALHKLPRFKLLASYLEAKKVSVANENYRLRAFLKAAFFASNEQQLAESIDLNQRTNYLFARIATLCAQREQGSEPEQVGAFLIIKDALGKAYCVYDKNANGNPELEWNKATQYQEPFLVKMLDRKMFDEHYPHSVMPFKRDANESWTCTSGMKQDEIHGAPAINFLSTNIQHLLLLPLTDHENNDTKILGVVGLYYNVADPSTPDLSLYQYLLLLKPFLNTFVHSNHQNKLFREWLISEYRKKFVLLTGHGKNMMLTILQYHDNLQDIALHYEHMQATILINENFSHYSRDDDYQFKLSNYFNPDSMSRIEESYCSAIYNMADTIFNSEHIENTVRATIDVKPLANSPFPFHANRQLLDLVFFELIINAKKNRWHFLDGKKEGGREQNELKISFELSKDLKTNNDIVSIRVVNTGPYVNTSKIDILRSLNDPKGNVKKDYATSGTAMMKEIMSTMFEKGHLKFTSNPHNWDEKHLIYEFIATLTFLKK